MTNSSRLSKPLPQGWCLRHTKSARAAANPQQRGATWSCGVHLESRLCQVKWRTKKSNHQTYFLFIHIYTILYSSAFLLLLISSTMSYNHIQNITDICSTFFGHTLFAILDSSLLGSALIHRVSTSELHRATLYPTPICSPIAWHFYLKKHGAGIFRRMLCYGVRCFRHGMNCLHPVYFH